MICRDANAADIDWLAATSAAIYASDFVRLVPGFDPGAFDIAHFARRFESAWPSIRIAKDRGTRTGFCLLSGGNIDMLFVVPAARGSGAGPDLLRDAERRGASRLECFAANRPARRFYEREGWIAGPVYERPFGGRPYAFVQFRKPA